MDRLTRTPLLLEFAHASAQRLKPGGASKARTRRLSRTSASMPHAAGEGNIIRRVDEKRRLNQARDRHPGLSGRRAQRDYRERRGKPHHHHLSVNRKNPNVKKTVVAKRGNPQAKTKTQIRVSPSKQKRRPTLPNTPPFFGRGSLMKGHRV